MNSTTRVVPQVEVVNTEGTQEEGKQSRCNLGLIRDRSTCASVALVRVWATEASGIRRRLLVWVTL